MKIQYRRTENKKLTYQLKEKIKYGTEENHDHSGLKAETSILTIVVVMFRDKNSW